MPRSKRYQEANKKVDKDKIYPIAEAIKLTKELANTKFDSSVELHIKTGINPKKSEQQIRGSVTLPYGTGKSKKIAAFVGPDKEKQAKEAGADIVGGEELINKIKQEGSADFDIAVATPDIMPKLAVIARVLGPRGLMPSPKNDTITTDLKKTIDELKKGKINFKNDDTGNIHQIIGKTSFTEKEIEENFNSLIQAIKKAKPSSAKGSYIQSTTITSTMGPGIRVSL